MTTRDAVRERRGKALLALAGGLPLLLLGALLLGPALAPARAEGPAGAPACRDGRSLLGSLAASRELDAIGREAAAVPNGEGTLFRIERDGLAASFLFGTMHLSDPRILDVSDAAEAALAGAGRLVIESTDLLDAAKVASAVLMRPDLTTIADRRTLADLLGAADLERLRAGIAAQGVPFASVERLQPWFVTVALMNRGCEAERQARGEAVLDLALARQAAAAGKPVLGLESTVEQLEAIASLPMDVQLDSLLATLAIAEALPDILETTVELYEDGRIAAIGPAIEALAPGGAAAERSAATYAAFEERIIRDRNRVMAERLAPILAGGGTFVAVGALHLPGETGLVELLRQDGWRVTRAD